MRAIVADDAPFWREAVVGVLSDAGIAVIAELGDATALIAAVRVDPPDVVVVDVRMPPDRTDDGLRAALTIRREHPAVGVLVLSQYVQVGPALELLAAGRAGVGYLLKERVSGAAELLASVRAVARGASRIDPVIADRLLKHRAVRSVLDELTAREHEILALIAEGDANARIAERLVISRRTVEAHIRAIMRKLDLQDAHDDARRVAAVLTYLSVQA